MTVCSCSRPITRFQVDLADGALMLTLVHDDGSCELPLRGDCGPVLRALLAEQADA